MTRMVKRPERGMGAPSDDASGFEEEVEADALASVPGLPGVGVAERSRGERVPRLAPSLNSMTSNVSQITEKGDNDADQRPIREEQVLMQPPWLAKAALGTYRDKRHLLFPSFQDMVEGGDGERRLSLPDGKVRV